MKEIHNFAVKWLDKFRNQEIDYIELVDHYLADDCDALGFEIDSGEEFSKRYGSAVYDYKELKKIIDYVNDIELLGSAIYSRWRYFNHWAYDGEEILEDRNRSWFILALKRLLVLSAENNAMFKGIPKTINIVSNNICYGPCPEPTDEVEQHLTISSEGQVKFSSLNFGYGMEKYEKGRSEEFNIGKPVAGKILNAVGEYFSNEYIEIFATDIGDWNMEIINTDGESYHFRGSLCADFEIDGIDLSNLIRDEIGIKNLYIFDGNNKPDKVNKIIIEYHRVTKIKPKESASESEEYVTWDYKESLTIDRKTETIEHIQNIGTGCIVSRKFQVQGGVENLLDDLDGDSLFEYIEGNPSDVIENPREIKGYKITIELEKEGQRIIIGTFDKKGLPEDWEDFAETVLDFILFYGLGEILDPSIYNLIKRRKGEYIYCSVTFDDSYKTYYYLTDDDSIEVGDLVMVPAGKDNNLAMVKVVKIEYFQKEKVPLPINKTKKIVRKCTDEDFDSQS